MNTPILRKPPTRNEGRDGDTFIVRHKGMVYLYTKVGGKWYKKHMEEA